MPKTWPMCSIEGCDRVGYCTGPMCNGHNLRLKKYGDPLAGPPIGKHHDGRRLHKSGYIDIFSPGHPLARRDGYLFEHRKVVHDAGIDVPPGHHVHHLNGDKTDNRLENLEVLSESEHHRQHVQEAGYVVNQYGTWPLRSAS